MYIDWIATTLDRIRQDPNVLARVPAANILARYAEPGDPPRLVTLVPAGGEPSLVEQALRVRIDLRCWGETGAEVLDLWQAVHAVLTNPLDWVGRGMTRWRLLAGPSLLTDPDAALLQLLATYDAIVYGG